MSQSIWMTSEVLKYDCHVEVSRLADLEDWKRQYEIYRHAESILDNRPGEHDLACAIFQLNRAIDFREKHLNKQYSFRKIPGLHGKKQHEAMSDLGIIKPVLKSKLDKIRNNVMHTAGYPTPKISEVTELLEFTWYFLKSTDLIASRTAETLLFNGASEYWLEVSFNLPSWEIELRGRLARNNLSLEATNQSTEVMVSMLREEDATTYFAGKLLGPVSAAQTLIKAYFSAF